MSENKLINEQEAPKPSKGDVWLLVLKDMEDRRQLGISKYGTPLQINNGRNPLVDSYQEALDLCVYLRQAIEERNLARESLTELRKIIEDGTRYNEWTSSNFHLIITKGLGESK